ncbi:hypothetical protein DMB42_20680 [Nonomuraea sp. WAC 01424]|uniref:FG-GAP-like repeat-containing protein n=1 Tax=Nonomuraea sp. WAC 01424 TaxID=2203200 RepID=UPI000F772D77|nr:FG-GAP repeat protein [Nonomuraea sp. WAC 01424]RSN08447.1 hypothetical protein DMB42_20680 [Nonomuraea sp. WAC 01424]
MNPIRSALAGAMVVALARGGVALSPPAATAAACAGAADFDGDGADDVAVGDPFGDGQKGAVHLLSGDKVIPVAVPGPVKGDGLGWSVRLADVNADACADLLVGAPFADVDGEQDAGSVYVVYGGDAGPPQRLTAPRPQRFAHFGWSLAARGNLVAIGAPYEDDGQIQDAGAVYVRQGTDALRRISQETVDVRGNSEVGDQFGWSLAIGPKNGLVVGVPYENDDGAGRQVQAGKIDSGSVVFIDDVLAARITSLKLDSPTKSSGDRYGYAVAYAEGHGYAISAPGPGYVQFLDPARKQTRTVKQGGKQAFGFSMAASADGRLAVGAPYGGGVQVLSWQNPADDRKLPTAEGLFGWSVAFSGNKLFVGQPDAPPYGKVSVAPRNADGLRPVQPPKGADFGASLAG